MLSGLTLAAFLLPLSLIGCGSANIDTGVPADTSKPPVTIDGITSMKGRMGKDMSKAAAAAKADAAKQPAAEEPK